MKILTNKQYKSLLNQISEGKSYNEKLFQDLKEAKNLKTILEKMSGMTINGTDFAISGGSWSTMSFPDTVLQYVDDILGGKVIKQEGTKCLIIETDGTVKTGLTKQKPDKKYNYKLVRKEESIF